MNILQSMVEAQRPYVNGRSHQYDELHRRPYAQNVATFLISSVIKLSQKIKRSTHSFLYLYKFMTKNRVKD